MKCFVLKRLLRRGDDARGAALFFVPRFGGCAIAAWAPAGSRFKLKNLDPVMKDAVQALCHHVATTTFGDLPETAIAASKRFILDTIGVGISGSRGPWVDELIRSQLALGEEGSTLLWGQHASLSSPAAALVNAYQIHNAEYDCVHEVAVVHPMAVLFGAICSGVQDVQRLHGRPVSGKEIITAVAVGVDVAAGLGVAAKSGLRFFRPATAGGLGAALAVGKLHGLDTEKLINALGIAYGQLGGTMQAHTEGAPLLAMQVGFNARNAVMAAAMAASGIPGTRNTLEGPFGYFTLFEPESDLGPVIESLGNIWRMTEVAHKPFPSGRATHGVVDACLTLAREHGFDASQVQSVTAIVPTLTHRLVSRPIKDDMEINYARLSAPYVAARALLTGAVGLNDFTPAAMTDAATLALGRSITVEKDHNPDPNALTPITVNVTLQSGETLRKTLEVVYGNPANPMERDDYLRKFRNNWMASAKPLSEAACEPVIAQLEALETVADFHADIQRQLSPSP